MRPIRRCDNAHVLMELAAQVVAESLDAERVAVLELAPGGRDLLLRAESGGGAEQLNLEALGLAALQAGSTTVLSRQAICARIERKDGSWGVMAVAHRRASDRSDADVSFVQAVANVLGAVVARAREEQLEAQLQQSRRLESVGKLAGGVAHDFNNLLAVILNCAGFALEAATDEGQRRDLEELSKAATRGAELVRQLLMNLTVNARDAMPDGGRLTIQATGLENGVRLVVEDTGFGMSAESRRRSTRSSRRSRQAAAPDSGWHPCTGSCLRRAERCRLTPRSAAARARRWTCRREPLYPPAPPHREQPRPSGKSQARALADR